MKIRNPFSNKNPSGWKDDATINEKVLWYAILLLVGVLLGYLNT